MGLIKEIKSCQQLLADIEREAEEVLQISGASHLTP
jgi:hypothetical protein